ncbi:long-chain fatty acid--CoA ligase [Sanguibacter sp. 25GB23B1]|uniref:long-chain-fatty-acid--CoA ligase n=1 Tax=unclassified Sanguibacter TaxID=2645534 RepID=UPI0032AF68AA
MSTSHPAQTQDLEQTDEAITGPGRGSLSVAAILAETAHRMPERTAVVCFGRSITYGDLWAQTLAYAGALRELGIGRGDRVAMLVPNVPDFPRVYYAALSLGAVVVPIHLLFKTEEIEFVLRDSGARVLVAAAPLLGEAGPAAAAAGVPLVTVLVPDELAEKVPFPRLEDLAGGSQPLGRYESVNPLAAATILYTSGTTGRPKGAVGSHLALVEQVHVNLLDTFDLRKEDVVFGGLPLFHSFGQSSVMNTAFRRGAAVLLIPRFEPVEALELMAAQKATVFTAVPTMYIALLAAAETSTHRPPLKYAVSGGASLPVSVLEAFESTFGAEVHEGYGLTETSPTVSFNYVGEEPRPGTVGRALWGVDVEIADSAVEDRIDVLGPGEIGEIVVRGHNLFKGYLGRPDDTADAMVDGWFRTGDLGTKDADDIITIVDRKKDMLVRNGYNVYPSEVEDVLLRHPGILNAAVFGLPDATRGQEIHAAVIAREGVTLDEAEVIEFVKERIAAYKYPRYVHLVAELPIGASGKVHKRELVAQFSADRFAHESASEARG